MADPTLQSLLTTTYTKENFHRKAMLLKEFFSKRFFREQEQKPVKTSLRDFLEEQNTGEALKESLLALPDEFFSAFSAEHASDIIHGLEQEVDSRPLLTLYVPTVLPPKEVEDLGKWARSNIREDVFLDLHVDASSVGGCSFVWNGVRHDYSLRYYFDKNRNEIRNLIRTFDNGGQ